MAKYKLIKNGVEDTETGTCIPDKAGNRDWKKYQEWLAEGNVPDLADPPPAPPTDEEIYNQTMQNNKLIKAMALTLNEAGAFSTAGEVLSILELKILIKDKM
ncbi:MAG: hypothetical protein KAS32_28785 [Candidatus Peribacteraceae bacterium]|nr:hypothetical protein [Candidatus Peribacteraceae bacterium]